MNAMAKSVGRRRAGSSGTGSGQKILLIALCVILAGVLAFELPKLLHGGSSSTPAPASGTTTTAAAGAVAATGAAATTGAATGAGTVAPSPASVLRTERWIKRLPARDPFVPLGGATNGSTSTSAAAPAASAAQPAAKPAAAPKPAVPAPGKQLIPTAAVIWTNGRRQVIGLDQTFLVGDQTFKLLSVSSKSAKVGLPVGGFKGGKKQIIVTRDKPVTVQNTVTGARYTLNFTLPMTVVGGR